MAPCNADGMEKKERRKSQIEVNYKLINKLN
jgi:hypothetical protein